MEYSCGAVPVNPILQLSKVAKTLLSVLFIPVDRNYIIHRDLMMTSVQDEITKFARKYQKRLDKHTNPAAFQLLDNSQDIRRLKR